MSIAGAILECSRVGMVAARGLEPLTSGLQSPRSAKLSYAPISNLRFQISNLRGVGLSRFELLTSRLSGVRSNQLSYRPRSRIYRKIKPLGLGSQVALLD